MERLLRRKYMKEVREQTVLMVLNHELTIPDAARRLTMSEKTLASRAFQSLFYEPGTSPVFKATLRAIGGKG